MIGIDVRKLKSKMVLNGYNQGSLANKMGVNRDTISAILNGKTKPNYSVMRSLCIALELKSHEAGEIFFKSNLHIT